VDQALTVDGTHLVVRLQSFAGGETGDELLRGIPVSVGRHGLLLSV
jgi:hypothetical protein